MNRTSVETAESQRTDLAVGYSFEDGRYVVQPYEYYASLPASSIDSTADDMAKLMIALLGDGANAHGRLFSARAADRVREPQYRVHPEIPGFTHGFWEEFCNGERVLQHAGMNRGYSALLYLLPQHRIGVFVAANRDSETGPSTQLTATVAQRLMDQWFPKPPAVAPVSGPTVDMDTARFAGLYVDSLFCHTCWEGDGWPISDDVTRISAVRPGVLRTSTREYFAVGPLLFSDTSGRTKLVFVEDSQGRIVGVTANVYSPGTTLERVDDAMLERVLGAEWQNQPAAPLVAIVYRLQERWPEAAKAYASIAKVHASGSIPWMAAQFYTGVSYVWSGQPALALEPISTARKALCEKSRTLSGSFAAPFRRYASRAVVFEIAALAGSGAQDRAFQLADQAVAESVIDRSELVELLTEYAFFKPMVQDPRFEKLRAR